MFEDLEKQYETSQEMKDFIELKKQGLINKNNELLEKLKNANGTIEQLTRQFNELDGKDKTRISMLSELMFKNELQKLNYYLMDNEILQKNILNQIQSDFSFNEKNEFLNGKNQTLKEYILESVENGTLKPFLKCSSSGSGFKPSNISHDISKDIYRDIERMTTAEVAESLNNADFRNRLN